MDTLHNEGLDDMIDEVDTEYNDYIPDEIDTSGLHDDEDYEPDSVNESLIPDDNSSNNSNNGNSGNTGSNNTPSFNGAPTLQRIIMEETEKYVTTNVKRGDKDWLRIEGELMKEIRIKISQTNQSIGKGEAKISMPKYLSFGQVAEILNKAMIIKVITDNDNDDTKLLGIFNGEIYDTNQDIIYRAAIKLNNTLTQHDFAELINRLMLICDQVNINKNRDLIAVGNGIFNYSTKELIPWKKIQKTPESYVFLSKSVVNYNKNAKLVTFSDGWNIENWLHDISIDDEIYQLLWETMGAVLRPYVKWNKSVWLYSTTGNNGKGTYCELLRALLGPKAHTSIPIADFAKEYTLGPLIGKQAIIVDENDVGVFIDKIGIMKAVITGDIVTINQKFKQPINYRFRGMMVQCLNEYPRVKDRSDSFYRRQIFVPFEKCFTGKENKNIKSVYLHDKNVLEYVLKTILEDDYYELSEPQICKDALNDYKESNDPVRQFWVEFETELAWDLVPYKFLYDLYKAWYDKTFPRAQTVSYNIFINNLKVIIQRESTIWTCDEDTKKKYRPGTKMSKTELLISQYKLTDWMTSSYQGRDPKKQCTLVAADLQQNYTGILRK